MRNLCLALLLANLLLLAWTRWVDPVGEPVTAVAPALPTLGASTAAPPRMAASAPGLASAVDAGAADGARDCARIGPLPGAAAAEELAESLTGRGIPAAVFAEDGQAWLGNWIQVGGFASGEAAEAARQRLVAGGLADAYLMEEGSVPVISLGVFRDAAGAARVADAARRLGFTPATTNRYRPIVEYWVRARVPKSSVLARDQLTLPGARILRVEPMDCPADMSPPSPPGQGPEADDSPLPAATPPP